MACFFETRLVVVFQNIHTILPSAGRPVLPGQEWDECIRLFNKYVDSYYYMKTADEEKRNKGKWSWLLGVCERCSIS